MEAIMKKISQATYEELQEMMDAIERRYASIFPQWEVIYVAVHKEPQLRRKELAQIVAQIEKGLP